MSFFGRGSPIAKLILSGEHGFARALLIFGITIVPYYNIHWSGGLVGALVLLISGGVLAFLLIGRFSEFFRKWLAVISNRLNFFHLIIFGIVVQVVVSIVTDPTPVSDGRTYLLLSEKLVAGIDYQDDAGHRAFWPPGLPFFLTPFVFVFEIRAVAIVVANIFLYLIGAWAVRELGRRLFESTVGDLAAVLFTFWPSRLLCAGLASKENLSVSMVLAGSALCVIAFESSGRRSWFLTALAGLTFGLAALAQPGLLLLVLAMPLAYRSFLGLKPGQYLARCLFIILFTVLTVLPWHVRNCVVFDGKYCGLTTNGGSVFYRANNPKATGLFTPEGEIPITNLPELEQNRKGFELGKRWILENPIDFLKLAGKKLTHLLGDDSYGADWAILRGEGLSYEQALKNSSEARLWSYKIAGWISLAFWVIVLALSAHVLMTNNKVDAMRNGERFLPLIYPLLYSAVIFSIFESGSRQHMPALGLLLVLASASVVVYAKREIKI